MLDMVNRSHNDPNGENSRKSWRWMLMDSLIIAAISFFSSLPEGPPTWVDAYTALKAFGLAFVLQLAIERGLKRPKS